MRARKFGLMLVLTLMSRTGFSDDVDYTLALAKTSDFNERRADKPFSIVVTDRVWAAPGVEQATEELSPPKKFDGTAPKRLQLEAAEGCRDADLLRTIDDMNGGPEWLDEVAWPRTRDLFGLGRPWYRTDDRQVFMFGGIALQR